MEHSDAWKRLLEVSSLYHCAQVLGYLPFKCLEYMDKCKKLNLYLFKLIPINQKTISR